MKYIKKVSVAQLQSNTGTIIDSMSSGDDHHTNAPSIDAVKNYVEKVGGNSYHLDVQNEITTTNTPVDTGLTVTLTTTGKPILVISSIYAYASSQGRVEATLWIDDVNTDSIMSANPTDINTLLTGTKFLTGITAGTHTFKIRINSNGPSYTVTMPRYRQSSLTVTEV